MRMLSQTAQSGTFEVACVIGLEKCSVHKGTQVSPTLAGSNESSPLDTDATGKFLCLVG